MAADSRIVYQKRIVMEKIKPPKFADRFLSWFIKEKFLEEALGDLYEYHSELSNLSPFKRTLFYWLHVFHFLRLNMMKSLISSSSFSVWERIHFNSKLAYRNLLNNKLISATSLVCLVIGSLCFHLIYAWYDNELSTDEFHRNINRIYLGTARTNPMADLAPVSLQMLFNLDYDQFPDVEKKMLIHIYQKDEIKFQTNQREFTGKALIADSTFFDFFDFKSIKGVEDLSDPSKYHYHSIICE